MFSRLSRSLVIAMLIAPSFGLASGVQALFDLEAPAGAPFPSDRFTVPDDSHNTGLRVNLPMPHDCPARPSDCGDVNTLNTLDGFNLQPRLSIPFSGPIDVSTVTSDTVFLVAPNGRRIGINQVVWDVESNTLHVESDEFLDQHTRHVLIVTRELRDLVNERVEASGAFQAFRHGKKIGHAKDDAAVTAYRQALLAGLELAATAGVDLNNIAVASVFTTQSITAVLEKIRDQVKAATPEPADFLLGPGASRTVFPVSSVNNIIFGRHLRVNPDLIMPGSILGQLNFLKQTFPGAVGQLAFGKYRSPDYLTPCTSTPCDRFIPPVGTRTGTPQPRVSENVFFTLFVPSGTPPRSGWPVVIFGLGFSDNKNVGPFRIAPTMAAHGLAMIVINGVGQGLGPLSTLTLSLSGGATMSFSAGGRSSDQDGNGVIGTGGLGTAEGAETLPLGSSISRRDSRTQSVIDLMQLVRVIEVGIDVDGDGTADLDPSRIYYFGFSHGADIGMMLVATEPLVRAAVLTAGGGNIDSYRLAPGVRGNVTFLGGYLARRIPSVLNSPGINNIDGVPVGPPHFNENLPLRDNVPFAVGVLGGSSQIIQSPVINTVPGAMEIQRVIDYTQWALQSGDGSAHAPYVRAQPLAGAAAKPVIVQFATGDQTVPHPGTTALLRSGKLADRATFFRNDLAFAAHPTTLTKNPHEFATRSVPTMVPQQIAIALQAQTQVAAFFVSDGAETIDPDGPCVSSVSGCFFEVPMQGPLPEDLGFIP